MTSHVDMLERIAAELRSNPRQYVCCHNIATVFERAARDLRASEGPTRPNMVHPWNSVGLGLPCRDCGLPKDHPIHNSAQAGGDGAQSPVNPDQDVARQDEHPGSDAGRAERAAVSNPPDAPSLSQPPAGTLQVRVAPWMQACFGPEISADKMERNHRHFEEATELVQALDMPRSDAHRLVDYVYDRPKGKPHQEVGGVMITLAALCLANNLDMHTAGEDELARIWTKIDTIRAKQATKPKNSPLPEASSTPPLAPQDGGAVAPSEMIAEAQAIVEIIQQFANTEEADITFLLSALSAAQASGTSTRKIVSLFRRQILHAGISEMYRRAAAPEEETERCINCGFPQREHTYNGACYGICGEFKATRPDSGHVAVPRDLAEYALGSMESEDLIGTGSYSRRERARIQREHDKQTERFRALLAATKQKGEGR